MELNKSQILDIQQNRDPYLMMDFVTDVKPGISSEGYKDLIDDWFFEVHWKNDPNMPGMLQIESLVQMASISILTLPNNKGKILYLTSAKNLPCPVIRTATSMFSIILSSKYSESKLAREEYPDLSPAYSLSCRLYISSVTSNFKLLM